MKTSVVSHLPAIREVDPTVDSSWDERIRHKEGVGFFHGTAWARVLRDAYRFRPCYLVAGDGADVRAALPLMEVDSWLTGKRAVSLPFSDHCPPILSAPEDLRELSAEACRLAEERGWRYCEFRGGIDALPGAKASVAYHGHRLSLQHPETVLFNQAGSAVRRAIRKAERSGLTVEFSHTAAALQVFLRLHEKTRRRHGLPPQPRRFFTHFHRHILAAGHGTVVIARHGNVPVAGAVFAHSGREVVYKFGASNDDYQHLRGNNFVMWRAIAWHAAQGFETLDFGRTSLHNAGLRQFKLGWGATEERIEYARFDVRSQTFRSQADRASGRHTHVFRHLPAALTRLIGSVLYRHIA